MMASSEGVAPALSGVRVCDLSTFAPGPFATQVLADLGATVLKVERPPGDPERRTRPWQFHGLNRGKHSIGLDLRSDADRDLLRSLIAEADVLVEGFRPGVMDRLGFGYAGVAAMSPRIVYVSMSGYGDQGPRANDRGYDTQYQAYSGAIALGRHGTDAPRYNHAYAALDYAAGSYAVIGIMAALMSGQRPVRLEVPVVAAGLAWTFPRLVEERAADGTGQPESQHVFATSDGRWLCVTPVQEADFRGLCAALDRPDLLARPDLQTIPGRDRAVAEINAIIAAALLTGTRDEWQARLAAEGVPVAPVLEPAEIFEDEQVRALDIVRLEPQPHAQLPVLGLAHSVGETLTEYDADGAAVRERGWAGLGKPAAARP